VHRDFVPKTRPDYHNGPVSRPSSNSDSGASLGCFFFVFVVPVLILYAIERGSALIEYIFPDEPTEQAEKKESPPVELERKATPPYLRETGDPSRYYPPRAVEGAIEGSVTIRLSVDPRGAVGSCEILKSSNHTQLDRAACRFARTTFRFDPARNAEGGAVNGSYRTKVSFRMD
jgi:TonB family protein